MDDRVTLWPDSGDMPNRVKAMRQNRGLTQEALAGLAGTSHTTIQRIESGRRGLSGKWVWILSDALKCHPGELFAPIGPEPSPDSSPGMAIDTEKQAYDVAYGLLSALTKHGLEEMSEIDIHLYAISISRALAELRPNDKGSIERHFDRQAIDLEQHRRLRSGAPDTHPAD